jgi:acetyl-CoA C-acetyltransferase
VKDVVIVAAVRTPIGNFGGVLKKLTAFDLGVIVTKEAMKRAKLKPDQIDEVIFANARPAGVGPNLARQISYFSDIPQEVPSFTVNKACGSGVKALILAYQAIVLGDADIVIAGGTESMSNVPYLLDKARFEGYRLGHGILVDAMYKDGYLCPLSNLIMGETAENLVDMYDISRQEQDEFALMSQQRAVAAIKEGRFKAEIVPVEAPQDRKTIITADTDEHPREDTSLEKLARLKPVFRENGTVTAGNSSGITDGAAAAVVASAEVAEKLNLKPMVRITGYAVAGVDPKIMGIGPVPATRKLLEKTGMKLKDFELLEFNEAFAAQMIAVDRELHLNRDILNVNGGAIALGHPTGCTGVRIVTTLLHEMERRKVKKGLASLCVSGGLGLSMSFEKV